MDHFSAEASPIPAEFAPRSAVAFDRNETGFVCIYACRGVVEGIFEVKMVYKPALKIRLHGDSHPCMMDQNCFIQYGGEMMPDTFDSAIAVVLRHEGGYMNDPDDPGGETNFGISKRSYPDTDIRNLTREQAAEIYRRDFWDANHCGEINDPGIALGLFDFAVNAGGGRAIGILQKSLCETGSTVSVDGKIGPKTIYAVNAHQRPTGLLAEFTARRLEYYAGLGKPKYLVGWFRRTLDCVL